MTEHLQHNRLLLALHGLKAGIGNPLLLLHGLGERSPDVLAADYTGWRGPVFGLDFTGHGASDRPNGGGYTCEYLMADVDIALARLGCATVAGRGLGGYIALLIAGARPELVRGAIICDGPGLAGGGTSRSAPFIPLVGRAQPGLPDPYALADLATDVRPPRYALGYAEHYLQQSTLRAPLTVCAHERPEWLGAVCERYTLERCDVGTALARYQDD